MYVFISMAFRGLPWPKKMAGIRVWWVVGMADLKLETASASPYSDRPCAPTALVKYNGQVKAKEPA